MARALIPDRDDDDLFGMLFICCGWIAGGLDDQAFLDRMAHDGPVLFAGVIDAHQPPPMTAAERQADTTKLFRLLGWSLLDNAPRPANGFRPQRRPLPGRNEPCLCGSGEKFKRCCAGLVAGMPGFDPDLLGALIVGALPAAAQAALATQRVPPQVVLGAAEYMLDDDRATHARRLLEPWSELPAPWTDDRADLLDRLGDTYLDLGLPRKRKQLANDMVVKGGPAVQSKGWQRLSLLAADAGDDKGAQQAFRNAQRLQPDDPNVALLEVTTLMGAGQHDTARERASFHTRRLKRLPPSDGLAHAIDVLEELTQPDSPLVRRVRDEGGMMPSAALGELTEWLAALPAPKLRIDLPKAPATDLEALRPNATLQRALLRWHKVFDVELPTMAWDDGGDDVDDDLRRGLDIADWLPLLKKTPLLADSFEVLDGLVLLLQRLPLDQSARACAIALGRALHLWQLIIQAQPSARCEWAWLENRPALRLLVESVTLDSDARAEHSFDNLRHLVEVLNPHDNHGLRERLMAVYLRRGDTAAAAALAARYPDDRVGMVLLTARTRLAEGAFEPAAALLQSALKANPHLQKTLLASRAPRLPNVPSYALGSVEEARIVVANQFDLWRSDAAVRLWLKKALDGLIGPAVPGLFDGAARSD